MKRQNQTMKTITTAIALALSLSWNAQANDGTGTGGDLNASLTNEDLASHYDVSTGLGVAGHRGSSTATGGQLELRIGPNQQRSRNTIDDPESKKGLAFPFWGSASLGYTNRVLGHIQLNGANSWDGKGLQFDLGYHATPIQHRITPEIGPRTVLGNGHVALLINPITFSGERISSNKDWFMTHGAKIVGTQNIGNVLALEVALEGGIMSSYAANTENDKRKLTAPGKYLGAKVAGQIDAGDSFYLRAEASAERMDYTIKDENGVESHRTPTALSATAIVGAAF